MQKNFLIYKFTSPSGKSYIGQTNNLKRRIEEHKLRGKCRAFNSAINKHGFENFTQEILKDNLTIKEANHWEVFYIKEHGTLSPNGYNLATGGDGSIPSLETRERMSAWQTGRKRPGIAEKTRAFHTGRKHTEDSRIKMAESRIGKKASTETKAKMSVAQKGLKKPPCSNERREKTSKQFKGIPKTAEHRARISESSKNKPPMSDVTKAKISTANQGNTKWLGKTHTKESKCKMSSSRKNSVLCIEAISNLNNTKKKSYLVTNPSGESIIINGMKEFCRENKLHAGYMFSVAKGDKPNYKGWNCKYLDKEKAAMILLNAAQLV